MADTKISGLPASTTPLAGTEVLPIVQSSSTVQVSVANLTAGRAVATGALTVTGTLSATGDVTLSGGTANGVGFLNASKVLTTGSALTFDGTNLSSTGGATFLGSPSGFGGGEVRLGPTTADAQSAISTQSTGSPQLIFDHRGTSNTGSFLWRNGTGGASELMRLTSSGSLLVGTTDSSGNNTNGFTVIGASGVTTASIGHITGSGSSSYFALFNYNGSAIGSITQSGTTAVLYNLTSDQRLKENIQDAAPASALIDAIQVRQFDWKSDGSFQRYGFIAQELVTVAPEAVHAPADPEKMMAVDYSKLVPMLVKELQSLRARVAQLESKP